LLREFLRALNSGEKTPRDLLELCLERIRMSEPAIQAWVEIAPQPGSADGLLRGIPFGVKDIIETRGMATEYGSPLYAGRKGTEDALVIEDLRAAGAVLLGKTQTAAFASFDATVTANPRYPGHTPGGSSSGSAAAVAAGMVPFAVGTQTLGSVLRPASFCGVCGFKPSYGLLPMGGIMPFAPSLDTVGLFTQTAADMKELWSRGFGGSFEARLHRAAWMRVPADATMEGALHAAVGRLRVAGVEVDEVPPPAAWVECVNAAGAINRYEGARTMRERFLEHGEKIGKRLALLVKVGLAMSDDEYDAARETVEQMRAEIAELFWEYPAIITPAAVGTAPIGLDYTGDPAANAPWTAMGLPAIAVPLPANGAPVGVQVTGAWGRDDALVTVAAQLERLVGGGE
jgi:Asp-tRNA(Asn)/Glu-tRNA(Gln) amidotransferase A subunit family amidase